jgi:hypothetical protein
MAAVVGIGRAAGRAAVAAARGIGRAVGILGLVERNLDFEEASCMGIDLQALAGIIGLDRTYLL